MADEERERGNLEWLNALDFDSYADGGDKVRECEFFLALASQQTDRSAFRWVSSAFLNAAYSYFECAALQALVGLTDPNTGDPVPDSDAMALLSEHVGIKQRKGQPFYVTTYGMSEVARKLYDYRRKATHHLPLNVMQVGELLPADFHLGNEKGRGDPALAFFRQVMTVIRELHVRLDF